MLVDNRKIRTVKLIIKLLSIEVYIISKMVLLKMFVRIPENKRYENS